MTKAEFTAVMDGTGLYYDPDHPDHIERSKIATLNPPFVAWAMQVQPFYADNTLYYEWYDITVWLYTDTDDEGTELAVKKALVDAGLAPRVVRSFDGEIELWITTYTMRLPEGRGRWRG